MVAGHGKSGMLFLYHKINQILLLRKLITESHAVIIYPKTDIHKTSGRRLFKFYQQFVVVVADIFCLPHTGCQVSSKVEVEVLTTLKPSIRLVAPFSSNPNVLGLMTGALYNPPDRLVSRLCQFKIQLHHARRG